MSRIGPMVEEHMSTTELYRDTGSASDSRRMAALGDHLEDRIGTRGVLMAAIVIMTLILLVAVAR